MRTILEWWLKSPKSRRITVQSSAIPYDYPWLLIQCQELVDGELVTAFQREVSVECFLNSVDTLMDQRARSDDVLELLVDKLTEPNQRGEKADA